MPKGGLSEKVITQTKNSGERGILKSKEREECIMPCPKSRKQTPIKADELMMVRTNNDSVSVINSVILFISFFFHFSIQDESSGHDVSGGHDESADHDESDKINLLNKVNLR
ncbi:hypothetical protein RhiirA4_473083 [Rhizophagus irregularis]|uniref:Uncharacterized protein n=1 Tax=Rhizophagus irregularis TaxID=588596 RepID=A0A2I1H635_9GLOM|nr:hypothetical protein RhiirA4_473083 [Rhizophagus irregularis]